MLHIQPDGQQRSRLVDSDGREIGWIHGRAVRFSLDGSGYDIMTAASKAMHALQGVLTPALRGIDNGAASVRLRLTHEGTHAWISDGPIPIARCFRPKGSTHPSLALQLVMPPGTDDQGVRSATLAIEHALYPTPRKSGSSGKRGGRREPGGSRRGLVRSGSLQIAEQRSGR
jgi:hypothetical protein